MAGRGARQCCSRAFQTGVSLVFLISVFLILFVLSFDTYLLRGFHGSAVDANATRGCVHPSEVTTREDDSTRSRSPDRYLCGLCQPGWESDYVMELFKAPNCFQKCVKGAVAYVYRGKGPDSASSIAAAKQDLSGYTPRILLQLSDEACNDRVSWGLYKEFHTVFRQYACREQYRDLYANAHHVKAVPLGYMEGMFPLSSTFDTALSAATETLDNITRTRSNVWAFAGEVKSDRGEAISTFKDLQPHFFGKINKTAVPIVYRDSLFVIGGRGWVNLDCFRNYEASINGAIPVIVGSEKEIQDTFGHFSTPPPWLFARSWKAARESAAEMLQNKEKRRALQIRVVKWWIQEVSNIQDVVERRKNFWQRAWEILTSFPSRFRLPVRC